jgi:carbon-monoxide dehydrogenase large subunit
MNVVTPFEGIGASVRRKEDLRFLSGRGQYTDDINRPNQTYAYILRSPHAHARIAGIDFTAAKAMPGVVAIFTGADMPDLGGIPCGWQIHNKDGSPMAEPMHPVLAVGKVRFVGDAVAVVIARRRPRPRTPPRRSLSTTTCCLPWWVWTRRSPPARRRCMTRSPAISATTGISATRQ